MATFPEREIPVGWNALVNHTAKTFLKIGEFKSKGKLNSALELVTKPTEAELDAHAETLAGYKVELPKPKAPAVQS